jgi:hypothetical protein
VRRRRDSRHESLGPAGGAAPVSPGSLAWASAVGNAAVQRLARQPAELAEPEAEAPVAAEAPAPEAAEAEGDAAPPEAAALKDAGIGPEAAAGLEAVDQLGEDALSD